jgi:surface antigen
MNRNIIVTGLLTLTLLGGCAGTYNKQQAGGVLGSVLGAGGAYGLAKDSSNKEAWIIAGALLGALAGDAIGAQLDERDRLLAGRSFQSSMELNPNSQGTGWRNPNTGNSGTVTPTQTYVTAGGQPCREFQQTVIVGGQEQQAYGTACRQADGSWKIKS